MKKFKIIFYAQSTLIILLFIQLYKLLYFYESESNKLFKIINKLDSCITLLKTNIESLFNEFHIIYPNIYALLNNREISIIILGVIFFLAVMIYKETRGALIGVLKALFDKKLIYLYILIAVYMTILNIFLNKIGFWELKLLKSAVVWYLFTSIHTSFKFAKEAKNIEYFKKYAKDNITVTVIMGFILNTFALDLYLEIIFTIAIIIFGLMNYYVHDSLQYKDSEYDVTRIIIKVFYYGIFALYIILSLKKFIEMHNTLETINFKEAGYIMFLGVAITPFYYLFVLFTKYELLFIRINFKEIINKRIRLYLKIRIVMVCNFNITQLIEFSEKSNVFRCKMDNFHEVNVFIKEYKEKVKFTKIRIMI